jgi:hypothetical protein
MTSSCVPQPSCAGLPVFVVTPPPDSNDTSGAPMSPIWSIDDFGFEPFSLDPLFLSTPPQRHSARRQGESKEEVDQITLDSFPLPPEHLPYQCPPPRNAARPIPDVPDEVASLPALSPSASSNLSEEWPGGEEDDDDSNTITASFMSSMNSWIGIVNVSHPSNAYNTGACRADRRHLTVTMKTSLGATDCLEQNASSRNMS